MMTLCRLIKFLFVFLLFTTPAWGADFTVCNAGCDETTIQAVFNNNDLAPGDVVEVRADTPGGSKTYSEMVEPGSNDVGDAGSQLTLQARSGDTITIDGGNSRAHGIVLSGRSYFTLDGFHFDNCTAQVVYVATAATGVILQNLTIVQDLNAASDTCDGITFIEQTNSVIDNCDIRHSAEVNCVYAADSIKVTGGSGNTVKYCYLEHKSTNTDRHNDGIQMWNDTDFTVYGNEINHAISGGRMQGIYMEGVGVGNYGTWLCYNNLLYGATWQSSAIRLRPKDATAIVRCYNNTSIVIDSSGQAAFMEGSDGGADNTTMYAYNNVFIHLNAGNISQPVTYADGVNPGNVDNNCYYRAGHSATTYGGSDINTDPSLDASYYPDDSGDPVVDTGKDLSGTFTIDKDQVSRPQSTDFDMGCYEYTGTAAPTGTLVVAGGIVESDVVTGAKTLVLTLDGTTWDADIGTTGAEQTALIAGITSNKAEAGGWNTIVRDDYGVGWTDTGAEVVRNSDTVLTITLPAFAAYEITASETITVTIASTCVASATEIVADPPFIISVDTLPDVTGVGWYFTAGGQAATKTTGGLAITSP